MAKITFKLTETLSSVLYHFTDIKKLNNILMENKFRLSTSLGSTEDSLHPDYDYFLSMSRVKHGGYNRNKIKNGSVNIVIDGDLLNKRFKGKPVNYHKDKRYNKNNSTEEYLTYNENEDRLYHTTPIIEDATKFIKEVHIFMADIDSYVERVNFTNRVQGIKKICDINKIQLFLYDNEQNFILHNKRKSIEVASKKKLLENLIDLIMLDYDQLDKENLNLLNKLDGIGVVDKIKAEINDINRTDIGMRIVENFSRIVRKNKNKIGNDISVSGIVSYLSKKFKDHIK